MSRTLGFWALILAFQLPATGDAAPYQDSETQSQAATDSARAADPSPGVIADLNQPTLLAAMRLAYAPQTDETQRALAALATAAAQARDEAAAQKALADAAASLAEARYLEAVQRLEQSQRDTSSASDDPESAAHLARAQWLRSVAQANSQAADSRQATTALWLSQVRDAQANQALTEWLFHAQANPEAGSPSEFWIGVQCEPAAEVSLLLESAPQPLQLKGGLMVNAVIADSPALAAGVAERDVILFLNDQPTNQIEELVAAIHANQNAAADLLVVRDQSLHHLSIQPTQRPLAEASVDLQVDGEWAGAWQAASAGFEVPQGFEAKIRWVHGTHPELSIAQGENNWVISDTNFDLLPEPVQPFARRIWAELGEWRPASEQSAELAAQSLVSANEAATLLHLVPMIQRYYHPSDSPSSASSDQDSIHSKLDHLQQQLSDLQKQIEGMRK